MTDTTKRSTVTLGGALLAITLTATLAVAMPPPRTAEAAAGNAQSAQGAESAADKEASPERPALDEATLASQDNIDLGKELWQKQCRHCHGRSAYPGKAPKLKPRKYKADFVYDRVTYGFRKMPAWEQVFDEQQRVGIVAFVMSKQFSP